MSNEAGEADAKREARWQAHRAAPKFRHIISELEGELERESYVYSTLDGAIELWRTPANPTFQSSETGYFGGIEIHSAKPLYAFAKKPSHTRCHYTPTGECWTDGSSMAFDRLEHAFDSTDFIKAELTEWHKVHIIPTEDQENN